MSLKDEGNALFSKKDYQAAFDKYGAAIVSMKGVSDKKFAAVLYGNRAACCLSMERYLDAEVNAEKSVKLNPSYTKSWGRLGSAQLELGSYEEAIDSFETAISHLTKPSLTAAESVSKNQYDAGIRKAKVKMRTDNAGPEDDGGIGRLSTEMQSLELAKAYEDEPHHEEGREGVYPWERVEKLAKDNWKLLDDGDERRNSLWMFFAANRAFVRGISHLRNRTQGSVVEMLCDAIMRDKRVFRLEYTDFVIDYSRRASAETAEVGGWYEEGPDVVLREAQERLKEKGWISVRAALSVTIQRWVLRAFLHSHFTKTYTLAIHWYRNVLELIDRGNRMWYWVPKKDRGPEFDQLFIQRVRAMYGDTYLAAYRQVHDVTLAKRRPKDPSFPITPDLSLRAAEDIPELTVDIKTLLEIAERILSDSDKTHTTLRERLVGRADPGIISSFCAYPMAEAIAIRAFCYRQLARLSTHVRETIDFLGKAHESHQLAALAFPRDDEYHALQSSYAVFILAQMLAPLRIMLPAISHIRMSIPHHRPLWEHSALAKAGRDAVFKAYLEFEAGAREHIVQGNLRETEVFVDNFMSPEVHMGLVTDQWMDEVGEGEDEGDADKTEVTMRFMKASEFIAKAKESAERDGEDLDEVERKLWRQIKEIVESRKVAEVHDEERQHRVVIALPEVRAAELFIIRCVMFQGDRPRATAIHMSDSGK